MRTESRIKNGETAVMKKGARVYDVISGSKTVQTERFMDERVLETDFDGLVIGWRPAKKARPAVYLIRQEDCTIIGVEAAMCGRST